jgi:chromosomal replication initiation ATPase DnaA
MDSDAQEALRRLRERLRSPATRVWLDEARVERAPGGASVLRVPGPFPKHWLETRCAEELEEVFGGRVEVVVDTLREGRGAPQPSRAVPRLTGPAGEFALRMVRAFAKDEPALAPLVVLHGPVHSGKAILAEWACFLGGRRVFRLDLERLRRGGSRGLVPRKPLVVADGVEQLAGREAAQRTLSTIVDMVLARGGRLLLTLEGHPGQRKDLLPALRSRLLGSVLVPIEAADPALEPGRRRRGPPQGFPAPPAPLDRMKDVAARLFGVERALLDSGTKRRTVVRARRTVMAAASRGGLRDKEIVAAFGLRSTRAVVEACRWVDREQQRDRRYAAMFHEVARVLAKA